MVEPEAAAPRKRRWARWVARGALVIASAVIADQAYGRLLPRLHGDPFFRQSTSLIRGAAHTMTGRPFLRPGWDRPASPQEDPVVGVFGGSVAHSLVQDLLARGAGPWAEALRLRFGRPVRFIDLTVRGGSEPAQFNLLHLSAHRITAAIFVDGFNEQFNSAPGCDDLVPFWSRTTATPSQILRPLSDAVSAYERDLALVDSPLLAHSGVFRMRLFNSSVRMTRVAGEFFVGLAGAPERLGVPTARPIQGEQANERWESCVRRSHEFARSRGLPIYFFVQPNQHVAGSKPFTPEETACCVELPRGTSDSLRQTYASITSRYADFEVRAARLRADGIPVRTLTDVFRSTREPLYVDWCCHVNALGNRLLADAIFGAVTPAERGASP
jgi:hypothetical protein